MNKNAKIYVAGHAGLAGSAITRRLKACGYRNLVLIPHRELDLTNQRAVREFFSAKKPEYVVLAAAKVGGILANSLRPAEFIYENLAIETNVIDSAHKNGAKKILFLGSSCIYPKKSRQPIKEEYLLSGPPEPTNEAYAVAKISGLVMCESYQKQYGMDFAALMPCNLYGPGDNYEPESSHVLAALIRKAHEAKLAGNPAMTVWGTGKPRREFLYSDDLARAAVLALEKASGVFNAGAGEDLTIRELAELVCETVGFKGKLVFDRSKPDGVRRKLLDISKIRKLGWRPETPLKKGLRLAYKWFLENKVKN